MDTIKTSDGRAVEYRGGYTVALDDATEAAAYDAAKGSYQCGLVSGDENLSGSSLGGDAKHRYGYQYKLSRQNFLARLSKLGIAWSEVRGRKGKRILVLGDNDAEFVRD